MASSTSISAIAHLRDGRPRNPLSTLNLVTKLGRQALQLEVALAKLDKYDLLVLDDLSYVHKDQAETSVLFELISARYERRSMLITANQPFGDWNKVFPDPAMTVAAIDRLVHHVTIFEMNVESYGADPPSRADPRQGLPPRSSTQLHPDCRGVRDNKHLANVNLQRQSSNPSDVAITIQIDARIHPDCRATLTARFNKSLVRV